MRRLRCYTCGAWVDIGAVPDEDFERMRRIGVKCGECVTAAIIDHEEGTD